MSNNSIKTIVEAALLAAGRPLSMDNLLQLFAADPEQPERAALREALTELEADWAERGLELVQVSSGYRFQVKQDLAPWMQQLWSERPARYSRALLETLAIIAYRQPVTRGEIEDIRGVGVSPNIIKTLTEREWIRELGHREVPGRPAIFGTTRKFLDHFGLKSLESLPPLSEIKDLERIHPDLFGTGELAQSPVSPPEGFEGGPGEVILTEIGGSAALDVEAADAVVPPDGVTH